MSEGNTEIKLSHRLIDEGYLIYHNSFECEDIFNDYIQDENDLKAYVVMLNDNIYETKADDNSIVIHTRIFKKFKAENIVIELKYVNDAQRKEAKLNKQITQLLCEQKTFVEKITNLENRFKQKHLIVGRFDSNNGNKASNIDSTMYGCKRINYAVIHFKALIHSIKFKCNEQYYKFEIDLELFHPLGTKLVNITDDETLPNVNNVVISRTITYQSINETLITGIRKIPNKINVMVTGVQIVEMIEHPEVAHKYLKNDGDVWIHQYLPLKDGRIMNYDHGIQVPTLKDVISIVDQI